MMPKDDWRRRRQEDYLTGVRLYHVPFTPLSEQWDHGHCEFCFEKFFLHPDHPNAFGKAIAPLPGMGRGLTGSARTASGISGRSSAGRWMGRKVCEISRKTFA